MDFDNCTMVQSLFISLFIVVSLVDVGISRLFDVDIVFR